MDEPSELTRVRKPDEGVYVIGHGDEPRTGGRLPGELIGQDTEDDAFGMTEMEKPSPAIT